MLVDCIADLHGHYPVFDSGELLIIAGDLTARDTLQEFVKLNQWLAGLPHEEVIVIAGNHDVKIQKGLANIVQNEKVCYLENSGTEFKGMKIWGMPQSLWFNGVNPSCAAFMCKESHMEKIVNEIPDNVDIIVSHSPPYGILDKSVYDGIHCGSETVRMGLDMRLTPRLFVCGHIHEGYGIYQMEKRTAVVNCSIMNHRYAPINKPIRIELE